MVPLILSRHVWWQVCDERTYGDLPVRSLQ